MILKKFLFERYLDKDETLLFSIHRHWITVNRTMVKIAIFGYLMPIIGLVFVVGLNGPVSYLFFAWIALAFCYSIYAFCDWYLDAWLLTEISIIDTSWDGFFKQRSSRIDYESVESIDIEIKGIKQSLFNYGDIVLIRNSGVNVVMENVSKPQMASNWLGKVQSEIVAAKGGQDSESIKKLLADVISEHISVNS